MVEPVTNALRPTLSHNWQKTTAPTKSGENNMYSYTHDQPCNWKIMRIQSDNRTKKQRKQQQQWWQREFVRFFLFLERVSSALDKVEFNSWNIFYGTATGTVRYRGCFRFGKNRVDFFLEIFPFWIKVAVILKQEYSSLNTQVIIFHGFGIFSFYSFRCRHFFKVKSSMVIIFSRLNGLLITSGFFQ